MQVGLVMIVKDEAAIIERCLTSVRDHIDHWTIVDTGSTDGTPELVEKLLDGIPGELWREDWVDFGHNRTWAMERAALMPVDWLLTLDADHCLDVSGDLDAELDGHEAYLMQHIRIDPEFSVPRLLSNKRSWVFMGRTHEHVAPADPTEEVMPGGPLHAWKIDDHHDGSSHVVKYERDLGMLEESWAGELAKLDADPEYRLNSRTCFYLAQTYRNLGRDADALAMLRKRIMLGGAIDEVYYAMYQSAIITVDQDLPATVNMLLGCVQADPTRAEPWTILAHAYRMRGAYNVAVRFSDIACSIPDPGPVVMFCHRAVYVWGALLERAYNAVALNDRDTALATIKDLQGRELPPSVADEIAELAGKL